MRSVWSLRAAGVGLSAALLISCNVVRPGGAYLAEPYEPPDAGGSQDGGTTTLPGPDLEAGVVEEDVSLPPPGPGTDSDGGSGDSGLPDELTPHEENLKRLAGRYWMRFDAYSDANVNVGLALNVKTRVSQLILTQLNLDPSTNPPSLLADEKLCYVTFDHACITTDAEGCAAGTVIDPEAVRRLRADFGRRRYSVDPSGNLTMDGVPVALGYDSGDDTTGTLPQSTSDARVWDIIEGGPREGLLTDLTASVNLGAFGTVRIQCRFYVVQYFVSAFTGAVPGWAGQTPALDGVEFALDTTGSTLKVLQTLQIEGDQGCDAASPETVLGGTGRTIARLARVDQPGDDFWTCPGTLGAFDGPLPADPP